MLNKIINTLDTVSKVVNTVDKVATTTQEVITTINNTPKSNALDMANTVTKVANIISNSDLEYLANQSTSNLNSILAGMSSLMNENNIKVEMLESQNWYNRMIKTVIGKNKMTENEIRQNHDKLNMYMSQAIANLYDRNCIDNRMMISLGNQVNNLYEHHIKLHKDHIQLKAMLGEFVNRLNEKIESVDNFHILNTEISQGLYSKGTILEAICSIISQLDKRTIMDTRKMGIIERSIIDQGIINDEKIRLSDFLIDVKNISYDNIGIIYMDQSNTRGNFISNLILNISDSQNLLLDDGNEYYNNIDLIEEFIENEKIDKDIELSTRDIYNELIQGKIDKINGLSPVSKFQYKSMMQDAERAYLEYDMEYAEYIFNILAEKNVTRAMYFLGELYAHGYGNIEKNIEKSFYWRRRGYENKDVLCYLNYAFCINNNEERAIIFNDIFEGVLELANKEDIFAQNEVADMYYYGYGTDKDLDKYIYWLNKASNNGNSRSIKKLADCYYNGIGVNKDEYAAYDLYKKAAEIGEANAQNIVANYYYNGEFESQNYEEAIRLYKKSANQGHHWAQSNLANCYRDGKGVKQDYNEAFKLYLEAAQGDIDYAQYEVAYCYMNGLGTDASYVEGIKWYKKASNNGNVNAMLALGDYHSTGIFKSKSSAFNFYKKAAESGNPRGQKELGNCYRDGIGTKVDYIQAEKWYRKSAEQGFAPAMTNLGWLYSLGKGVVKNGCKSVYWHRKGAEAGSAVSQYALACFYYNGEVVKQDIEEAKFWYVKSAKNGNKDAIKALKKYYKIKDCYKVR